MWCNSCGNSLDDPTEDLHDPKGEFLEELGPVENPDSHHIKAVYGEKGVRILCANTGKMTKLVEQPPGEEDKDIPGGAPSDSQEPKRDPNPGPVYDLEEEKQAEDILNEVIGNPAYGLSDGQIEEVESWLRIYDGRIPPDMLQDVLYSLDGISKQKAKLMRQKYEALINKWIVDQTQENDGPPIGSMAAPPSPNPGAQGQRPQKGKSPKGGGGGQQNSRDFDHGDRREVRQGRRQDRRQEVIDTMADEMARNVASNAGQFYNDMRDIFTTLLKRKAERDPEWFFEKADAFGMDIIDELSEPSQAKTQEKHQGGERQSHEVDQEVDKAVQEMMNNGQQEPPDQRPPPETHNTVEDEPVPEGPEDMQIDQEEQQVDMEGEDEFDQIFSEGE